MRPGTGERVALTLPGGLVDGDRRHQLAEVRALTGREEELLAEMGADTSVAEQVTALLGRCVTRLGSAPVGPGTARRLTVGDREALLIALRWATMGDRIDSVLTCPAEGCGRPVDLLLRASQLLVEPYPAFPPWHEERFGGRLVRFRLPTGEDQEQVAWLARLDPAAAARQLLARCLDEQQRDLVDGDEGLADSVGGRMAELDPQAELRLRLCCAWCAAEIDTVLDMAAFLFAEASAPARRLYEEVHVLARTYHWGEGEILGLSSPRRRRYLELIADAYEVVPERMTA
jgi:hypothetical protein